MPYLRSLASLDTHKKRSLSKIIGATRISPNLSTIFSTSKQELSLFLSEQILVTQALVSASSFSALLPFLCFALLTKLGDLQNTSLHMAILIKYFKRFPTVLSSSPNSLDCWSRNLLWVYSLCELTTYTHTSSHHLPCLEYRQSLFMSNPMFKSQDSPKHPLALISLSKPISLQLPKHLFIFIHEMDRRSGLKSYFHH